jgi:hypothetical protein
VKRHIQIAWRYRDPEQPADRQDWYEADPEHFHDSLHGLKGAINKLQIIKASAAPLPTSEGFPPKSVEIAVYESKNGAPPYMWVRGISDFPVAEYLTEIKTPETSDLSSSPPSGPDGTPEPAAET